MVTVLYLIWRCPQCKQTYSSSRTPRNSEVYCVHDGVEVLMIFEKEVWM